MGKIFVVATPIGNLADTTFRSIEILKSVDVILSEDTRETEKLLNHYSIQKPQISYRDQNHSRIMPKVLDILKSGGSIALVSDSGTPSISDPGFKLIRELVDMGYKPQAVPGPSAVVAALSVSGLPTDKFVFLGFLPKGASQRKSLLLEYGKTDATLVIYESPFRVQKLLEEIHTALGNRRVCVAKDITKLYEHVITDYIENIDLQDIIEKGEYVLLVAKEGF